MRIENDEKTARSQHPTGNLTALRVRKISAGPKVAGENSVLKFRAATAVGTGPQGRAEQDAQLAPCRARAWTVNVARCARNSVVQGSALTITAY